MKGNLKESLPDGTTKFTVGTNVQYDKPLHEKKISELYASVKFVDGDHFRVIMPDNIRKWAIAVVKNLLGTHDLKAIEREIVNVQTSGVRVEGDKVECITPENMKYGTSRTEIVIEGDKECVNGMLVGDEDRVDASTICGFLIERFDITLEELK